jgi:acetolactate synthase-1/2/3 large subunit
MAATAARSFLTSLKSLGVDYVFANAGTDFAPIVEALAEETDDATQFPEFVICPHENLAVAMAQGYYLASGTPQAAMVHVNVGVANAVCGLMNAARDNIPMIFASGRTPVTEGGRVGSRDNFIHWGQEMFDQAAIIREIVKWDYELRYPEQAATMVARAMAIARSSPPGPVYLSLPREALAQAVPNDAAAPRMSPCLAPAPVREEIEKAAALLAQARAPLIITSRAGRTAEGFAALAAFAEAAAIPVVEFAANYACLPGDHPMHAGYSPAALLPGADLVIAIEAPIPYPPARVNPPADCKFVAIGVDPLFARLPYRGFSSDVTICAETGPALDALADAYARRADVDRGEIDARRASLAARFRRERETRLAKAAAPGRAISHAYASRCINEALGADAILVNERGCLRDAMIFTKPGAFFGPTTAGGLGASIGVALGAKMARPDRIVAAALGDGSCIFNNPVACLQLAAARRLAVLVLVLNNGAWHSVKASTLQVYPDGATAHAAAAPLTYLSPSPDYAAVARACGGRGLSVADPQSLPAVLEEAVAHVRRGESAMLVDIAVAEA